MLNLRAFKDSIKAAVSRVPHCSYDLLPFADKKTCPLLTRRSALCSHKNRRYMHASTLWLGTRILTCPYVSACTSPLACIISDTLHLYTGLTYRQPSMQHVGRS